MRLIEKLENLEFYATAASKYLNNTLKPSTIKKYSKEIKEALNVLEDIEDELGVDLITLLKALKNGIHKKDYLDCCYDCKLRFMKDDWYLAQPFDENYSYIVKTKDYGKTWALTKEELE